MEIKKVGKRRRARTAGEPKGRLKRELLRAIESSYGMFEALTHLLAQRALTHLNLLPGAFGGL